MTFLPSIIPVSPDCFRAIPNWIVPMTHHDHDLLLREYRAARDRLNAGLDLIDRSFDLRELLACGLDLEDMQAEVADFTRAVQLHRRSA
jgi:hypothetical protein